MIFTDGAKDIRRNIEEVFEFRPYSVILDWHHLKKRCQEYLSMSITGGKKKRNEILQKLLRILGSVSKKLTRGKKSDIMKEKTGEKAMAKIEVTCPYCKKNNVVKYGKSKTGVQRFQCRNLECIVNLLDKNI